MNHEALALNQLVKPVLVLVLLLLVAMDQSEVVKLAMIIIHLEVMDVLRIARLLKQDTLVLHQDQLVLYFVVMVLLIVVKLAMMGIQVVVMGVLLIA